MICAVIGPMSWTRISQLCGVINRAHVHNKKAMKIYINMVSSSKQIKIYILLLYDTTTSDEQLLHSRLALTPIQLMRI